MELISGIKWTLSLLSTAFAVRAWIKRRRVLWPRELRDTPAARIGDAVQGRVRLTGVVRGHLPPIEALFSGAPCLAYEVVIDFTMGHGLHSFIRRIDGVPFGLDDGSGLASVDIDDSVWLPDRCGPAGLSVVVAPHETVVWRAGSARDARVERLLAFQGLAAGGAQKIRITEAIVEHGDWVTVVGSGFARPDPLATTAPGSGYAVRASGQSPLIGPGDLDCGQSTRPNAPPPCS